MVVFGLIVWVFIGVVLVVKVIGVLNLGVSNNLVYSGCWGCFDDEERVKILGYFIFIKIF